MIRTPSVPRGPASSRRLLHITMFATVLGLVVVASPAQALEVWSGRTLAFVRPPNVDWNQPQNQDRITPNVWLTRKSTMGIFNIKQEAAYGPLSPTDTEWATGDAVNHASLTFTPWVNWAASNPPATVGVNAVVHLKSEDIYIDIRFDSWGTGIIGGGAFSYTRGEPPVTAVEPGAASFALRGFLGNPARANTPVEFTLPDGAPANLEAFDLAGRLIARREVGSLGAGVHRVELSELRAVEPGLVFVRLVRDGRTLVARGARLR